MKNHAPSLDVIGSFNSKRILVIGDLILDVYLKGRSTRLCPEAPVPVVDVEEKIVQPGGAANTVCNLRSLGASVKFCTVTGNDPEGLEAISLLSTIGIDEGTIIRHPRRTSITKSRVVSGSQVITRIDQGSANILDIGSTRTLLTEIERNYDACDAVIISDYDKGLITQPLIQRLGELRKTNNKFLAIDSKRLPSLGILKPSYAKPNYEEALKILGLPRARNRVQQISAHAKKLFRAIGAPLITVTLDEEGTVIIEHGRVTHIVPAPEVTRPSVAGAGDAYISAFVLSHLACGDSLRSAEIATAAASIAIRKNSTALCSHAELKSFFNVNTKIITDLKDLEDVCEDYRAAGKRIVFTNGCFDILHSGHVAYLHRAKQMGDVLVVGLNTDDSIRRIKGPDRPINALADRLQVLAGLSSVDHIIPFGHESDDTPIPVIRAVRPDIFAKGGDYTKEKLPEADSVEACGGQIVLIDHVPDHSTTRIINRIASSRQPVDIKPSGKDYDTLERL